MGDHVCGWCDSCRECLVRVEDPAADIARDFVHRAIDQKERHFTCRQQFATQFTVDLP